MPLLDKLPEVSKCCGCVTDLKTAAAIIAVLGIVTSPALSWAVVRHAYVIRVSCFVTSSATRPDVVDINLNNILSFGFGANAGLGPSCLARNTTKPEALRESDEDVASDLVSLVRSIGWIVLLVDLGFLFASVNFLIKMFKMIMDFERLSSTTSSSESDFAQSSKEMETTTKVHPTKPHKYNETLPYLTEQGSDKSASKTFMITALVSIILSFLYGMLFVTTCIYIGGSFPIYEFVFSILDLIIWMCWLYFLWVLWWHYYGRPEPLSCIWRSYYYIIDIASNIIRY